MANATVRFKGLLEGLPLVKGVRRMTKAVLREMMALALSEEIGGVPHPFGCMSRQSFLERMHWIWKNEGDYLEHTQHDYLYGDQKVKLDGVTRY